jgi:hypothetical protein
MCLSPQIIDALVESGCTVEQLAAVVKADLSSDLEKAAHVRELTRKRVQNYRARNALHRVTNVTPISPKESSPTPPKEITPLTPLPHSETKVSSLGRSARGGFLEFWSIFPNKVGKRAAEGAWEGALKRTDFDTLISGLDAYVHKTDDRPWCNPSTWLNQDRWNDRPATVQRSTNGRHGIADVYLDKLNRGDFENANGSESIFSNDSHVKLLPPSQDSEHGSAREDVRGSLEWRGPIISH